MKLLGVRLARSIWLVPRYFLNTKGAFLRPAVALMRDRYSFLRTPLDLMGERAKQGEDSEILRFESGGFQSGNGTVAIASLAIHSDGIVAEAQSSTEDADAFIADAINFVAGEFDLPTVEDLPVSRIYVSELNVRFNREPVILNPAIDPFIAEVSSAFGGKATFLGCGVSLEQGTSERPAFRFERELKTKNAEHRFYSFAALPTKTHIQLLTRLEEVG